MNTARRSNLGYTLIELIVVLVIISIAMAMAAPSFRGWNDGSKLRNAADQFSASARWARAQAIITGTPHVLKIDASTNTYAVSVQTAGTQTTSVAGEFGRPTGLPVSFGISLVSGGQSAGEIVFFPNGRCTPGLVRITSAQGKTADIASTFPADPFRVVVEGSVR